MPDMLSSLSVLVFGDFLAEHPIQFGQFLVQGRDFSGERGDVSQQLRLQAVQRPDRCAALSAHRPVRAEPRASIRSTTTGFEQRSLP
ncbi:hypothetical protein DBZ45_16840 [Arthrobacter globiformis]|uniref:Uncharacterized protein n=1 Tax=Arthrobacter globiformis TaxID=1665 RepID=A0A328HB95_ARTGO|nr:hypothetical protein DBZ45_16840 [Arthrobacter globiformis]